MKHLYDKPLRVLEELLKEEENPYTFEKSQFFHGGQIVVNIGARKIDAICKDGSYGSAEGLLEIMGGLTEEEHRKDFVLGFLTPEEVAKRFIYCYKNKTTVFGSDKGRDVKK